MNKSNLFAAVLSIPTHHVHNTYNTNRNPWSCNYDISRCSLLTLPICTLYSTWCNTCWSTWYSTWYSISQHVSQSRVFNSTNARRLYARRDNTAPCSRLRDLAGEVSFNKMDLIISLCWHYTKFNSIQTVSTVSILLLTEREKQSPTITTIPSKTFLHLMILLKCKVE